MCKYNIYKIHVEDVCVYRWRTSDGQREPFLSWRLAPASRCFTFVHSIKQFFFLLYRKGWSAWWTTFCPATADVPSRVSVRTRSEIGDYRIMRGTDEKRTANTIWTPTQPPPSPVLLNGARLSIKSALRNEAIYFPFRPCSTEHLPLRCINHTLADLCFRIIAIRATPYRRVDDTEFSLFIHDNDQPV